MHHNIIFNRTLKKIILYALKSKLNKIRKVKNKEKSKEKVLRLRKKIMIINLICNAFRYKNLIYPKKIKIVKYNSLNKRKSQIHLQKSKKRSKNADLKKWVK